MDTLKATMCRLAAMERRPYSSQEPTAAKVRRKASAFNGRGPWRNSGASHMNDVFRKRYFDKLGLYGLIDALLARRRIST